MKNQKINIVSDAEGKRYRQSKSKELFFVRLSQSSLKFTNNFLKEVTLSCLVFAKLDLLEQAFPMSLKSLTGKLVIKESFTPSDPSDLEKDLKRAGSDDAPICVADGKHIYRKIIYDPSSAIADTLIPHTNVDEIRAFHNGEEFVPADTEVSDVQA